MIWNEKIGILFFFFSLGGGTSTDGLMWACWLCPARVGFMKKTSATGSGPQDGCTWHPRIRKAKRLAKHTHATPSLRNRLCLENCFHASDYFGPFSTIGPTIFYLMQMENRRFPALTSKACQSLHLQ